MTHHATSVLSDSRNNLKEENGTCGNLSLLQKQVRHENEDAGGESFGCSDFFVKSSVTQGQAVRKYADFIPEYKRIQFQEEKEAEEKIRDTESGAYRNKEDRLRIRDELFRELRIVFSSDMQSAENGADHEVGFFPVSEYPFCVMRRQDREEEERIFKESGRYIRNMTDSELAEYGMRGLNNLSLMLHGRRETEDIIDSAAGAIAEEADRIKRERKVFIVLKSIRKLIAEKHIRLRNERAEKLRKLRAEGKEAYAAYLKKRRESRLSDIKETAEFLRTEKNEFFSLLYEEFGRHIYDPDIACILSDWIRRHRTEDRQS